MANNSNLNDLRKLRTSVEKLADELNLKVGQFDITPGKDEHDNDVLKLVMFITVEAVETVQETEQRHTDAEFDSIFAEEFGDMTEFADDDTKALLERESDKKRKAAEELQRVIDEMEND